MAPTDIHTLSLHDALPILRTGTTSWCTRGRSRTGPRCAGWPCTPCTRRGTICTTSAASSADRPVDRKRSEEHTSELQSRQYLVCRLLLEKKKLVRSSNRLA